MILKNTSTFTPAPEGLHDAVCVDVVDRGFVDTTFGKKHKLRIFWEIAENMEDGKRFIVMKQYGVSLHEKATLRKDLKGWRGRDFTADELKGFDIEAIIGAPCQILVAHNENEGATYANVNAVMKASTVKLQPSGEFIRFKDREDKEPAKKQELVEGPF